MDPVAWITASKLPTPLRRHFYLNLSDRHTVTLTVEATTPLRRHFYEKSEHRSLQPDVEATTPLRRHFYDPGTVEIIKLHQSKLPRRFAGTSTAYTPTRARHGGSLRLCERLGFCIC
jgi:hypothetical protein